MSVRVQPLIFGEVLFDVFDDQNAVLGGAPFNVAWHLQGLGINPLFISRTGDDSNGEEIRTRMQDWGMLLDGIQLDPQHPTGVVAVQIKNGENSFTIRKNQSFDFIDNSEVEAVLKTRAVNLIYHGSLCLRNQKSRNALETTLNMTGSPVFLDVNLRNPWWKKEILRTFLDTANWVKCNRDELDVLSELSESGAVEKYKKALSIIESFNLNSIIVTMGEEGAFIMNRGGELVQADPIPAEKLVDTVGAGDAFSAVSILGILRDWKPEKTLKRAIEFASKICEIQGATLKDRDYYASLLKMWENHNETP